MLKQTSAGVEISLYIQPNASKTEIIGEHNGLLKIKIKAPPVEGKANDEVIRFLSKELGISKSQVELLKGDKSREKKVLARQLDLKTVKMKLGLAP